MNYIDREIIFESDKIYFNDNNNIKEVMMDWEDHIMKQSANYICGNGGDILEIGFGMGISANYIQSNDITSYTIIENHPDVIIKALEWSKNKKNVKIIQSDWFYSLELLDKYDGILYDTYGDQNIYHFKDFVKSVKKEGTLLTWWNSISKPDNILGFTDVEYDIYDVNPPENSYFNFKKYYLPKKEF